MKYPFSHTKYLHTKWRQRQLFECHNVQQRQRRAQRFCEQNIGEMISDGRKYVHM